MQGASAPERLARLDAMFTAMEEMDLGVIVMEGLRVVWANHAYARLLGFTLHEVLAPDWDPMSRVPPEEMSIIEERSKQRASGDDPSRRYDMTLLRKDGARVRCHIGVTIIEPGDPPVCLAVVRAVGAPHEMAPSAFDGLVEALGEMGDAIGVIEGGRFVRVSAALAGLTGHDEIDLLAGEVPAVADLLADATGGPRRMRRKDGRTILVECAIRPIGHDRHVIVARDVTQRATELALLREHRDLVDVLLDAQDQLDEGVVLVRGPRRIEYANEALARIVGRPLAQLLGTDVDVLGLLAPGEAERLHGRPTPDRPSRFTTVVRRPTGEDVYVEVAWASVELEGTMCKLAIVRDVTGRKRDADALQEAQSRLATTDRLAALGGLVSGVAHEIRTPLTVIENQAHLLDSMARRATQTGDHAALAKVLPSAVSEIVGSVERTNGLVRNLRRFTQQPATTMDAIDLGQAVGEALHLFRSAYRGRARIEADLAPTPPVLGNTTLVQQVVINLLENAMHATGPRDPPIEVVTRTEGVFVELEVRDHGHGMPPGVAQRILDPLFTTKQHGMGLGLTIVKRILDEHHATLSWTTAPGEGTAMVARFRALAMPKGTGEGPKAG